MNQNRQHYLYLWQLASSLEEGWWEDAEKDAVKKLLKDAISLDPKLTGLLSYSDPDLFQKYLPAKLHALILSKSELGKSNLPPEETRKIRKLIDQKSSELAKHQQKPPVRFTSGYSNDIYLILKKYNLVDSQGKFNPANLANSAIIGTAQEEIGFFIAQKELQQAYRQGIIRNLEQNKAPVTLILTEVFGNEDTPGLIDLASEKMAKSAIAKLKTELGTSSFSSPGFSVAFRNAAFQMNLYALSGQFFNFSEAQEIIDMIVDHPTFRRLTPANQDLVRNRLTDAFLKASKDRSLTPQHIYDILIRPEDTKANNIRLEKTAVDSSGSVSEPEKIKSVPQPRTIAEMTQRDLNLRATVDSTNNIQGFIDKFAEDPIAAVLEHPYYSFINLLPKPIKDLYWKRKGMEKTWKTWYGISTSPEAQRQALQKLGWNAVKSLLKTSGLVNEKGQWIWMSTLGWLGDKAITGIGEGLSKLFSKIPIISTIFRNRLGKDRDRKVSIVTAVLSVATDIALLAIKLLPKAILELTNLIFPGSKAFLINAYTGLEARFGFLHTIRMGAGIGTSFLKGIFSLNTLAGAGFGYVLGGLIGGHPAGMIFGGTLGALYQGWFNIANNPGLIKLLTQPAGNFFDTFLKALGRPGVFMSQHGWARFPLKGFFSSYLLWQLGFPWYIVISPPILQWIWETKGWWGGKIATAIASRFPIVNKAIEYISGFLKSLGIIGEIIGGGLPGLFFALQLGMLLHLSLPQILLLGAGGWIGWGIAARFFPHIFGLNLFSLAGGFFGQWLAAQLGLTGWAAFAMQLGSFFAFNYLGSLGLAAISSWLGYSISLGGLLFTVIESIFYYLIPIIVSVLPVIMVLAFLTVIVYTSLFLNPRTQEIFAPPTSECFAPTKTVEILDKNTRQLKQKAEAGDILRYTINFGARKEEIKNVVLKDEFRIGEFCTSPLPGQSWGKSYIDPQSFSVISEPSPHQGPSSITDRGYGTGDCQESWQRVSWSNFSVIPSSPVIIYEIKVADGTSTSPEGKGIYQGGSILNQILLDGDWSETIEETYNDPDTGEVRTRQATRKANCKIALSGYVNSGTKEAADLAITIFQVLNQCQENPVTEDNLPEVKACLANAKIPQPAIDEIEESVNKYDKLQCVGFVKACEAPTGGTLQNIDNLPYARDFWRDLPGYKRRYRTAENKNDLKPGDILIWTTPPEGHMAIVVQPVFDSEGQLSKIIIAEAIGGSGLIRIPDPIAYDGFVGWLRRN